MTQDERTQLRLTFDQAADRYERIRPGYPNDLFDDIDYLAGLHRQSRVLEIGCGTGQATEALATRGYQIVAVELGSRLAAAARRRLGPFPNVEIVVDEFERWSPPREPFDAVIAATTFHWLDPEVRVSKSADALRPGGALAIVNTDHIAGGSLDFFVDVQDCYELWDPKTTPGHRLPSSEQLTPDLDELERSGRFGPIEVRRYEWERSYTTSEYLDLLLTYSGHLALDGPAQAGLLDCIQTILDERHGGRISKRYLTTLRLARRLDRNGISVTRDASPAGSHPTDGQ